MQKGAFLLLLLLLAACDRTSQAEIDAQNARIAEYNALSAASDALVLEHNAILADVRKSMGDDFSYRRAVGNYLAFAQQRKANFTQFADFIRANAAFLEQRKVGTTALLVNLQDTVDTIDRNSKDFNSYLANTREPASGTAVESTSLKSRFNTVPLYR